MASTQSNGTVLFRSLVMVAFLAVIFYAALSGNVLPDAARKNIEKFLPRALIAGKPANSENANPSSAANAAGEAPLFNAAPENKTAVAVNSADTMPPDNQAAPRPLNPDGSASLLPAPSAGGNMAPSPVVPVNYQTPADGPPAAANPFLQVQDRLKQMGATYYLLETWGNQQQLYRFYCKMAVGGNPNYTRCFEYIGADPQQAMAEVLKQVEAWRNGGSQVR